MEPVLEVENLSVTYRVRTGLLGRLTDSRVVHNVTLNVGRGEIVALVGESGSGKSTLVRAAMRLIASESGTIRHAGTDVTGLSHRGMRVHRRDIQMVFQDPYSSLDPAMTVLEIVAESLISSVAATERELLAGQALSDVGLSERYWDRYPHEFSGGQRQRVAIARALAPSPKLIICDEPVSALDISTQNQILDLLVKLKQTHDMAILIVSHDLSVVDWIADRVYVMYCGEVVEEGDTESIFERPRHPYTLSLLSAIPSLTSATAAPNLVLEGDLPNPASPPPGCRFHTRCPLAFEPCSRDAPATFVADGDGQVACHLHVREVDPLHGRSVRTLMPTSSTDPIQSSHDPHEGDRP